MGQQVISGSFRNEPNQNGAFCQEATGNNQRTLGATIIDLVSVNVPLGESWTIVSWEIAFNGSFASLTNGNWAKLGKVIGGLITTGASQTLGPGIPWVVPMEALPTDISMLATLWDGATDPSFPPFISPLSGPPAIAQVVGGLQLPVPVVLRSSATVGIGVWITPSLIGGPIASGPLVTLLGGQWTIVFDDGDAPKQGWTG